MFRKIATNNEFWDKVRQDTAYKPMIDRLFELYDECCISDDIPATKYSLYKLYFETGDRLSYENPYFYKRRRLNTLAILSLIYPEKNEYLEKLQDTIWAICDEYSWVLPAHVKHYPYTEYTTIDLFSAETAFALSEIKFLLSDRLSDIIINRINDEINKQVLLVFENNIQSWEAFENNWSAVCAASVGAAFMYQNPKKFYSIKPRIDRAMDAFLNGYPSDGACLEGLAYWEYGFGFYVWYAELLNDFTGGAENLFLNDKIIEIADFAHKTYLTDKIAISFSDSSQSPRLMVGMLHYLKQIYGDKFNLVPHASTRTDDNCGRWCHHVRSFVFFNPDYVEARLADDAQYHLKDAGWYIKRTPSYSFAVKAGNNDEPHNHNDIGSFILAKGDNQILADLGNGEYTKQYFNPETRYSILCNSSFGHSVPVINGKPQSTGAQFCGDLNVQNDTVVIDIKNAYNDCDLVKLERYFEFKNDSIKLLDRFGFNNKGSYQCRLVSHISPLVCDNRLEIDNAVIEYDSATWTPCITKTTHSLHSKGKSIEVYLIDFISCNDTDYIELNISFNE